MGLDGNDYLLPYKRIVPDLRIQDFSWFDMITMTGIFAHGGDFFVVKRITWCGIVDERTACRYILTLPLALADIVSF